MSRDMILNICIAVILGLLFGIWQHSYCAGLFAIVIIFIWLQKLLRELNYL